MIELNIKIKENKSIKLDEGIAIDTGISFEEIGTNPTKNEKVVLNILKERLKFNEKVQFENLSKRKSDKEVINDLLNKLL